MSPEQKNNAIEFPFPNIYSNDDDDHSPLEITTKQKGASKEQIKTYNAWAKKINAAMEKAIKNKDVNDYPIIKLKEFEKYKYLYDSVMTDAQRKSAVPFPDKLPPPPPPPPAPEQPKKESKNKQKSNKIKTVKIDVDKSNNLLLNGTAVSLNNLASEAQKINPDLSNNQTMNFVEFSILLPNENYNDMGKKIRSELRKVKIYKGYTGYMSNEEKSGIKSAHYSLNDGLSLDEAKANNDRLVKKFKSEKAENLNNNSKGNWSVNYGIESVEYVETNNNSNSIVYKGTSEFDDLTMRKLILKVSKQQTQPLSYMLNGKKSTASEIEKFLQNNQDADVSFSKGKDSNTLSFSENTGSKMTYDELQALYSSIFKTYNQSLKQIEVRSIKNDKN